MIELDGETLAQTVEEFNRYRGAPIIVGDPRLANLRVGGRDPNGADGWASIHAPTRRPRLAASALSWAAQASHQMTTFLLVRPI